MNNDIYCKNWSLSFTEVKDNTFHMLGKDKDTGHE